MLDGLGDGFRAAGDAQFGENAADVKFCCGPADEQLISNFRVAQTVDHQPQHLALAISQVGADPGRAGCRLNQCLGRFWSQGGSAGMSGSDSPGQFISRSILSR